MSAPTYQTENGSNGEFWTVVHNNVDIGSYPDYAEAIRIAVGIAGAAPNEWTYVKHTILRQFRIRTVTAD